MHDLEHRDFTVSPFEINNSLTNLNLLEQVRAALPDAVFAKHEGIDPHFIYRINAALSSSNTDDSQLIQLLIESRTALPIAWQNHGGCSDELLKAIDLTISNNSSI